MGTHVKSPDTGGMYASQAKNGFSDNVRMYADLVAKHKKERGMIELRFIKQKKEGDAGKINRNVEMDVVAEYIFSQLKVNPEEFLEVDLNTGRQDTKQILFRPGVNIDKYTADFPDSYLDYIVNVSKMTQTEIKVSCHPQLVLIHYVIQWFTQYNLERN